MANDNTCVGILPFSEGYLSIFDEVVKPIVQAHTWLVYKDARNVYESKSPKIEHISEIISSATVIVADISEKNVNVFLEIGFALALRKRIVFIVSKESWKDEAESGLGKMLPFDLQGRELIIYNDKSDLKIKLPSALYDCLYKCVPATCSWIADNEKSHIQSSDSLAIEPNSAVWSDEPFTPPFSVRYSVELPDPPPENADVRIHLSARPKGSPQICCIFPWAERQLNPHKKECHIDIADDYLAGARRLQQLAVCDVAKFPRFYDVFLSFGARNFIFESTLFEAHIERLVISTKQLLENRFEFGPSLYIGFFSLNVRPIIRSIKITEHRRE
jgi:hypothetical protein